VETSWETYADSAKMHPWLTNFTLGMGGSISKWPLDGEHIEVNIIQLNLS
jgi:hypothetical protein